MHYLFRRACAQFVLHCSSPSPLAQSCAVQLCPLCEAFALTVDADALHAAPSLRYFVGGYSAVTSTAYELTSPAHPTGSDVNMTLGSVEWRIVAVDPNITLLAPAPSTLITTTVKYIYATVLDHTPIVWEVEVAGVPGTNVTVDMTCTECTPGFYYNTGSGLCLPITACAAGFNETVAATPSSDRQCVLCAAPCAAGTYQSRHRCRPSASHCQPCHASCSTCSGPNATQCLSCAGDAFLWLEQCIPECPATTVLDRAHNTCLKCQFGLYDYFHDRLVGYSRCLPCGLSCATCSGALDTDCITCDASAVRCVAVY